MIKLVVFDWNGTLFDDTKAVLEAANASEIPLLGLAPITLERMREVYEVPIIKAYENMGVDPAFFKAKSDEISPVFHKVYEPLVAKSKTRIGAHKLLKNLHNRDMHCIILSNHTMEGIYFQLTRLKLGTYFNDVLANDTFGAAHHTGKQHRIEAYLQANHYQPDEVVIVGDTPEEVRIGKALDLHTVAITGGMCSRARLVSAKPEYLVSSLNQLTGVVEQLA